MSKNGRLGQDPGIIIDQVLFSRAAQIDPVQEVVVPLIVDHLGPFLIMVLDTDGYTISSSGHTTPNDIAGPVQVNTIYQERVRVIVPATVLP